MVIEAPYPQSLLLKALRLGHKPYHSVILQYEKNSRTLFPEELEEFQNLGSRRIFWVGK